MSKDSMKQEHMPLVEALEKFNRDDPAYFCIPAHRGSAGIVRELADRWGEGVLAYDRTETDGLDDLHHPEQAILQAQQMAASLFGADRSWFLVNGTTCGNEAMILACAGPGEKIAVPRNAHKSVCMGLILSGAVPVWMQPEVFEDWGFVGEIFPATVEKTLQAHPDIKAVLLTSPTYQGVCSNLRQIADLCHERRIPLLVDEAHGAHLYFHERLPEGALQQGADLCVQSTHKTLGGLTQSSMLHLQGKLVSPDRVDDALKLVQSTSPSYLLMASLDAARMDMALRGRQELEKAILLAEKVSRELEQIPGLRVFTDADCWKTGKKSISKDPLRLVFSAREAGFSGLELKQKLYDIDHISLELAEEGHALAILSFGNTERDAQRLVRAVRMALEETQNSGRSEGENAGPEEMECSGTQETENSGQTETEIHGQEKLETSVLQVNTEE